MTRPMGEPNAGKRIGSIQKATRQLQRRPAPTASAASGLPCAFGNVGQRSLTTPCSVPFDWVSWNDDSVFGYRVVTGTTPKRAEFVEIKTEGIYRYDALVDFNSDFAAGDFPFIQPTIWTPSGGGPDPLSNWLTPDSMDNTQDWIGGELQDAVLTAYRSLYACVVFAFTVADFDTTIGLGVKISSSNPRTKNIGAMMSITRLGDLPTLQTIV